MARYRQSGLTLIELVTVIMLVGVLAVALLPVFGGSLRIYSDTTARMDLTAQGRLALERLAREVRHAVPNSLRIGPGGDLVFVLSRAGGRYLVEGDRVDGSWCTAGGAFSVAERCFRSGSPLAELYVLGLGSDFALLQGDHLIIGNSSVDDLAQTAVEILAVVPTDAAVDGTAAGHVVSFAAHAFQSASPGQHFFIADRHVRIGLDGQILRWRETPGIEGAGGGWAGTEPALSNSVEAFEATYSPGTTAAAGVLRLRLVLARRSERVELYQEVQVRNAM